VLILSHVETSKTPLLTLGPFIISIWLHALSASRPLAHNIKSLVLLVRARNNMKTATTNTALASGSDDENIKIE
jgi:hypothetical protein